MLFISNFVFEINNIIPMKKTILVFGIALIVLITTGLWISKSSGFLNSSDALSLGVVLCLVAFAIYIGFRRLQGSRRGEPAEDELSRNLLRRTASLSYYLSLYFWVGILFIKDRITISTEELLGMGILGMAVIYAISWIILNIRGIKHE
jgi:peptidoglycan/LPS O-acetylase OafA/YrhL